MLAAPIFVLAAAGEQAPAATAPAPVEVSTNAAPEFDVGGQLRVRWDGYSEPIYASGADEGFVSTQLRAELHADWRPASWLRLFAQVTAGAESGRIPMSRPADETAPELTDAFVQLTARARGNAIPWSMLIGRQELSYGRFVTSRDGTNLRRTFDGIRVTGGAAGWSLDGAVARPTLQQPGLFDDRAVANEHLVAVTLNHELGPGTLTAAFFRRTNPAGRFLDAGGREQRNSWSLKHQGKRGLIDWDLQGALQTGRVRRQGSAARIRAYGFSAEVGHAVTPEPLTTRIAVRIDAASGDRQADDGRLGTFDLPYPNLTYISDAALFAPRNLISLQAFATIPTKDGLNLTAGVEHLWRWRGKDAVYSPAGSIIVPPDDANNASVAVQPYLRAQWQLRPDISLRASAVWIQRGELLQGRSLPSQLFGAFQITGTF